MPSMEDYAPDGGNAPINNPDIVSTHDHTSDKEAREAFLDAKKPGAKSAMVIPTHNWTEAPIEHLRRPTNSYILEEAQLEDARRIPPSGPWTAVALENGDWISGELIGQVGDDDSVTLRRIFDIEESEVDGETEFAFTNIDTTVAIERIILIQSLEGDRWTHQSDESNDDVGEPDGNIDPLTGFPRRSK